MINPTFKDTVTLYHQHKYFNEETKRNVTEWIRSIHKECYFGSEEVKTVNGTTLSLASSYTARIPYGGVAVEVVPGDIVARGEITDEIEDVQGKRATDLISKHRPDCFTVRTVKENTKIRHGAHYKLIGV